MSADQSKTEPLPTANMKSKVDLSRKFGIKRRFQSVDDTTLKELLRQSHEAPTYTEPQRLPWFLGSERNEEIYDAAGDLVATMGNGFNSLAQDIANAVCVVESVNGYRRFRELTRRLVGTLDALVGVLAYRFEKELAFRADGPKATSFMGVNISDVLEDARAALGEGGAKC